MERPVFANSTKLTTTDEDPDVSWQRAKKSGRERGAVVIPLQTGAEFYSRR